MPATEIHIRTLDTDGRSTVARLTHVPPSSIKLFIATPTWRGAHPRYVETISSLSVELTMRAIPFRFRTAFANDVAIGREVLAYEFLASDCTHCLWLDDDQALAPEVVFRMLEAEREFIACACRFRQLEAHEVARPPADLGMNTILLDDDPPDRAAVRADRVGFGVALTSRAALERVIASGRGARYRWPFLGPDVWLPGIFARMLSPEGFFATEDLSFGLRYRACGGTLWLLADAEIEHWQERNCWRFNLRDALKLRRSRRHATGAYSLLADGREASP